MSRSILTAALVFLSSAASWAGAQEKDITLKELPKAVVAGIKAKYPGAKLVSAEKEMQGDKVFYEVNIKNEDRPIELLLTPEGKIVSVEQSVAAKDLPKAVAQAIQKRFPKATVKNAEETVKGDKATYAVLLENDVMIGKEQQKVQLQLTSAGEVTAWQKLIAASDLPKAAAEALAQKYPNIPIVRANQASEADKISYIVSLKSATTTYLTLLDTNGKILKESKRDNKK